LLFNCRGCSRIYEPVCIIDASIVIAQRCILPRQLMSMSIRSLFVDSIIKQHKNCKHISKSVLQLGNLSSTIFRSQLQPPITNCRMLHHLMIGTWTPPGAIFTVAFDDEELTLKLVKKTSIPHDEPISWMAFDVREHLFFMF